MGKAAVIESIVDMGMPSWINEDSYAFVEKERWEGNVEA